MHRPEPNFNVAAQVIKQAERNPSNTATIFEGKTTTYGEFASRVRAQAGLLRVFAEKKLARYKLPIRLHVADALSRNPAGKVLKFELRETLA
jgi:acyl-CoA synthetase (AMP-forming)/AMP-acid ligase II